MSKKKILLVDDSETTLMMERLILSKYPYELLTAKDGIQAVKMAHTERPDLILMDVVMPDMNGFEACRMIRKVDAIKHIPIIMVTTRGEEKNITEGFDAGTTDYVTKPVQWPELISKIRKILGE